MRAEPAFRQTPAATTAILENSVNVAPVPYICTKRNSLESVLGVCSEALQDTVRY